MTTPIQGLKEARRLISSGWCQDAWARTIDGTPCNPTSPEATSWCIRGALRKAFRIEPDSPSSSAWAAALDYVTMAAPIRAIATFNDYPSTKKEDILAVLSKAIHIAEQAE